MRCNLHFFLIFHSSTNIDDGYMKLYLLKNLPAKNLLRLLGILCNLEYYCICETQNFIAMKN